MCRVSFSEARKLGNTGFLDLEAVVERMEPERCRSWEAGDMFRTGTSFQWEAVDVFGPSFRC